MLLISAFVQAYLASLTPRQRARFLKRAADTLEAYQDLDNIRRIRSWLADAELAKAAEQALAWYRQVLPTFLIAGDE